MALSPSRSRVRSCGGWDGTGSLGWPLTGPLGSVGLPWRCTDSPSMRSVSACWMMATSPGCSEAVPKRFLAAWMSAWLVVDRRPDGRVWRETCAAAACVSLSAALARPRKRGMGVAAEAAECTAAAVRPRASAAMAAALFREGTAAAGEAAAWAAGRAAGDGLGALWDGAAGRDDAAASGLAGLEACASALADAWALVGAGAADAAAT
mmetsp:Transcript_24591/g.92946  ORF Transcript_24591/g.92946 Transcript_24591/m.92946 type:complete len:208 (-) Transcript_24591:4069-4692(-)